MRGPRVANPRDDKLHGRGGAGPSLSTILLVAASGVMLLASVAVLYSPRGGDSCASATGGAGAPSTIRGAEAAGERTTDIGALARPSPCPACPTCPSPLPASEPTGRAAGGSQPLCRTGRTLDEIGIEKVTDKRSTFHGFLHHYDRLFARDLCKQKTIKVLELGIFRGASMATWIEYFGGGQFYGVDHLDKPQARAKIKEALDANPGASMEFIIISIDSDMAGLKARLQEAGPFDIVLDDASHRFKQQFELLKHMMPFVKPGGWFVTEDLHTSLRGEANYYGGNDYERPLDLFNALENPEGGLFKPNAMFSAADFEALRAVTAEVVVYYHHRFDSISFEGINYKPFTSVTGAIRKKLA